MYTPETSRLTLMRQSASMSLASRGTNFTPLLSPPLLSPYLLLLYIHHPSSSLSPTNLYADTSTTVNTFSRAPSTPALLKTHILLTLTTFIYTSYIHFLIFFFKIFNLIFLSFKVYLTTFLQSTKFTQQVESLRERINAFKM